MNENISITATIFITDKCNLACKYCYEENKQYQTIKKEYIDKFIDLLYTEPKYSKRKYIVLDFIGGEALLEWSLMEYAMTRFLEKGRELHHPWVTEHRFTFFNTTNGTLFGEPSIRDFSNRWKCLRVGVSLDGCKKAHDMNRVYLNGKGSYDKVMENMEWWKHRDHEPMVKGTMNHDTLPMLADMLINQIQLRFEPWANPIYEQVEANAATIQACMNSCSLSCSGNCKNVCSGCSSNCGGNCTGGCITNCQNTCSNGCTGCRSQCANGCGSSCDVGCAGAP